MPSPIIARADALMHRRRQSNEFNEVPVLTDAIDEDDEIPLLTDIDTLPIDTSASIAETGFTTATEATLQAQEDDLPALVIDPELRDQLVYELTRRIEERIKAALPQIISSTVRDFLAEQEMIANN